MNPFQQLFSSGSFMPHGSCYMWDSSLIFLHVISDALITIAYYSIPITLLYFVRRRRDLQFSWIFILFAFFIVACGTTHLMEIWNIWHPTYWLSGTIKGVTALASVFTAAALIRLIPQALALASPKQLTEANDYLKKESQQRQQVEREVRKLNATLESRVSEITEVLTQRKKAEQKFRGLLESSPDAIVIVDSGGNIVLVNSSTEKLFGYQREGLLGQKVEMLFPERFRNKDPAHSDNYFVQPRTRTVGVSTDLYALRRDRSEFPVEISLSPLETEDGVLVSGSIRDITERRAKEELLREQARLLDLAHDAILVRDLEDCVTFWNPAAVRRYGWSREEALGKRTHNLLHTVFPEPLEEIQATLLRTDFWEGELNHITRQGDQIVVASRWSLERDNDGKPTGTMEINNDITEGKRIERALYDKNIELENASKAKNRFLANMSHELRTPLNGIIGFAEFLVDGKPGVVNRKQKEYLEDILNSGRHLLQLINDLLDLAKVEAGKMDFNPEEFLLDKAIEEVCAVSKPMAKKKGIHLELNGALDLGYVTLDQQRFKQVLYNLLSNAIKFTGQDGKVEIGATLIDASRFKLIVRDTGIGIKTEDLDRLFKEFEQLGSGATRLYEGTGLGLALTRKIVESQGGTVGVESKIGTGSKFTVVLPLITSKFNI